MKQIFFSILLLWSVVGYSQQVKKDSSLTAKVTPGDYLIKSQSTYLMSLAVTGAGTALVILKPSSPIGYIGIGAGFIIGVVSRGYIARAGRLMNERGVGLASEGVGVRYRF